MNCVTHSQGKEWGAIVTGEKLDVATNKRENTSQKESEEESTMISIYLGCEKLLSWKIVKQLKAVSKILIAPVQVETQECVLLYLQLKCRSQTLCRTQEERPDQKIKLTTSCRPMKLQESQAQ